MTYKSKKIPARHVQPLSEKVLDRIDEYLDTTSAILEDYAVEDGLITELSEADKSLQSDIRDMILEDDYDSILERLKKMDLDDDMKAQLLDLFEEDEILSKVQDFGHCVIKIDNIVERQKLEDFVHAHIHTSHNQQQTNVFI